MTKDESQKAEYYVDILDTVFCVLLRLLRQFLGILFQVIRLDRISVRTTAAMSLAFSIGARIARKAPSFQRTSSMCTIASKTIKLTFVDVDVRDLISYFHEPAQLIPNHCLLNKFR